MNRISCYFVLILQAIVLTGWTFYAADSATPHHAAQRAQAPAACLPLQADRPAAEHIVRVDLDYGTKVLNISQRTRYVNRTGDVLDTLVFNVEPNQTPGVFVLSSASVEGQPLPAVLDGKRLTLDLPPEYQLGENCTLTVLLEFTINVPQNDGGRRGFFNATPRQMNLGGWLPTVAPYSNGLWLTRDPYRIGEQDILDLADWDVTLRLMQADETLTIAGPGIGGRLAPDTWRFTHENAREIALSISNQFRLETTRAWEGVTVETYTLRHATDGAALHFRDVSGRSLALFSQLFTPYTNERLVVVHGDFPDGMEFDGLMFVGDSWFTNWNGRVASYLTLITVHEVAHQWWYARVGNDAALTPWLDEALATYSEYIYLEYNHPDLTDWWWQFRVDNFAPQGFVDGTVYEFQTGREYINAVYLRGVRMLHALRGDLGDEAFFTLLRDYATVHAGRIATADDFWGLLTPEQLSATAATRTLYLRHNAQTTD